MRYRIEYLAIWVFLITGSISCTTKIEPSVDQYGCNTPIAVSTLGIDINYAVSIANKLKAQTHISLEPKIVDLASKIARDQEVRVYINCRLIRCNGYTQIQAAWIEQMFLVASTNPTQFIEWSKANPFPNGNSTVVVVPVPTPVFIPSPTTPPTTTAPVVNPPTTTAPVVNPPTTTAPVVNPPTTTAPVVNPPTTTAPVVNPPTTTAPVVNPSKSSASTPDAGANDIDGEKDESYQKNYTDETTNENNANKRYLERPRLSQPRRINSKWDNKEESVKLSYKEEQFLLAAKGGHADKLKFIISSSVNINIIDCDGNTALIYASKAGHDDVVQVLLTNYANPDLPDRNGQTALMHAVIGNHDDVVRKLLKWSVSLYLRDYYNKTALDYSKESGHRNIELMLRGYK